MIRHLQDIPTELKDRAQWVVWRFVGDGKDGKKPKKIPYTPMTGKEAETDNPATWASYGDALDTYLDHMDGPTAYAGLGFVLSKDDPYVGLDYDDSIEDGQVAVWADSIMRSMPLSYAEISPSGTGVKAIVRGSIPSAAKPQKSKIPTDLIPADKPGRIEMYSERRFFALTGNILPGMPKEIATVNGELTELHARLKPQQQLPTDRPTPATTSSADNADAYTRAWIARVEQTAVDALHNAVEGERHNTRVAQARLLGGLVAHGFMTEEYAADVIYRACPPQSNARQEINAIYDGIAYGVAAPLEIPKPPANDPIFIGGYPHCPTHNTPLQKSRNGNGWRCLDASGELCFWWHGEGYSAPAAPAVPAVPAAPADSPISEVWRKILESDIIDTDRGNARRLCVRFGDVLKHSAEYGWYVWDGRYWKPGADKEASQLAQVVIIELREQALEEEDEKKRAALLKHARSSESADKIAAMLRLAATQPEIAMPYTSFDQHEYLLTVRNGTIDLLTGKLLPHDKNHLITKMIDIEYKPDATCSTWLAFLDRSMRSNQDNIDFLHKAIGYTLTGSTREQCMFFMYGLGSNGKSTFGETLMALLGGYSMKAPSSMFMATKNPEASTHDNARLANKRLVLASEIEQGSRLGESTIKDLTGGDTLAGRFLYKEPFDFAPSHKLWMYGNHDPQIRGTDNGIWRRIRKIPFTVTLSENEKDPNLKEKLKNELPGILAWAVQGCIRWHNEGLQTTKDIEEATKAYRSEMDVLGMFIDEACVLGVDRSAPMAALYKAYTAWCKEAGEHEQNQRRFNAQLISRGGITKTKKHIIGTTAWYMEGIALVDNEHHE